jgi:hypothetical protein
MALDNFKNTIDALKQFNWATELQNIVETNVDAIAQLQEDQWMQGKDKDGNSITLNGRGYAEKTIEIKQAKGQITDWVTLTDTGRRNSTLEIKVADGTFTESIGVSYEKELVERTGDKIYGLNEEKRLQFGNNVTLPAIKQIFKEKTGFDITT